MQITVFNSIQYILSYKAKKLKKSMILGYFGIFSVISNINLTQNFTLIPNSVKNTSNRGNSVKNTSNRGNSVKNTSNRGILIKNFLNVG